METYIHQLKRKVAYLKEAPMIAKPAVAQQALEIALVVLDEMDRDIRALKAGRGL